MSIFSLLSEVTSGLGSSITTYGKDLLALFGAGDTAPGCKANTSSGGTGSFGETVANMLGVKDEFADIFSSAADGFIENIFQSFGGDGSLADFISSAGSQYLSQAASFATTTVLNYISGGALSFVAPAIGKIVGGLFGGSSGPSWDEAYTYAACQQAAAIRRDARLDCLISFGYTIASLYLNGSVAKMQERIADREIKVAEQLHDQSKKYWDVEDAFLQDAFGEQAPCAEYTYTAQEYLGYLDTNQQEVFTDYEEFMRDNCIPISLCQQNLWDAMASLYASDVASNALRTAEYRREVLEEQRYQRQYAALSLGRGVLSAAQTYASIAGPMKVNIASVLDSALAFGYAFPRGTELLPQYEPLDQPYAPMPEIVVRPKPSVPVEEVITSNRGSYTSGRGSYTSNRGVS